MRHDNSKILGFGLLALAAVLALKDKKSTPKVGGMNPEKYTYINAEHKQRVDDLLEMFRQNYAFEKEQESKTTNSKYYIFHKDKAYIKLRQSDHRDDKLHKYNVDKRLFAEIDLVALTQHKTAEQAFAEATDYIEKLRTFADKRHKPPGKVNYIAYFKQTTE